MRDRTTPLESIVASFIAAKRAGTAGRRCSEATLGWYGTYLADYTPWLREHGRRGVLGDLEPELVEAYLHHRTINGRRGKGSQHQARAAAVGLKSLASYLAAKGILRDRGGRSVLDSVTTPTVDDMTRDELGEQQFATVLQAADRGHNGPRERAILALAMVSLRLNELRCLELRDLDFAQALISVRAETAEYRRARMVTLYPEAAEALDSYLQDHRIGPTEERSRVFTTDRGQPFTYNGFKSVFRRLQKRSGLGRRFKCHVVRHTGASAFIRAGTGSEIELRRQFGWSDHRMSDRYVHVRPAEERLARPSPFGGLRGPRSQVALPAQMSPSTVFLRAVK